MSHRLPCRTRMNVSAPMVDRAFPTATTTVCVQMASMESFVNMKSPLPSAWMETALVLPVHARIMQLVNPSQALRASSAAHATRDTKDQTATISMNAKFQTSKKFAVMESVSTLPEATNATASLVTLEKTATWTSTSAYQCHARTAQHASTR